MRIAGINSTELMGGVATIAVGAFALVEAMNYQIGTLRQMGPGYFPMSLGVVMLALGIAIIVEGLRSDAQPPEPPAYRSLLFVPAGVGAFGVLIERAGLVPASVALVLLASCAEARLRFGSIILLALAVSALNVLVFSELLGLRLSAFAW